jgi:nucleotide-binding universal stress UspA family protein
MTPIRQILVPVDFSEPSRAAFDYAVDLAKPFAASIDVIHVWEAPSFLPAGTLLDAEVWSRSLAEVIQKNAQTALEQFVSEAAKRGVVVRASRAETGSPALTIVEAAKTGHYDLIVMGTHGRTGLSRTFLGSVAERVVRHSSCPVLTVRTRE